jgi:hypothetical protein
MFVITVAWFSYGPSGLPGFRMGIDFAFTEQRESLRATPPVALPVDQNREGPGSLRFIATLALEFPKAS